MAAYEDKFKSSASEAKEEGKAFENIDMSGSLSQSKGKERESYETDTFEEQSASQTKSLSADGSAKKPGIVNWADRKNDFADSVSASVSVSKS